MRDGRGGREECCSGVDGLQMPGDSDLSEVELSQYSAGLCYAVCNVCSYTYIPPFSTFVPRFVIVAVRLLPVLDAHRTHTTSCSYQMSYPSATVRSCISPIHQ